MTTSAVPAAYAVSPSEPLVSSRAITFLARSTALWTHLASM